MAAATFSERLRTVEHTLACECAAWRRTILAGAGSDLEWPNDLPELDEDLKTWFAWRSTDEHRYTTESWRSSEWSAKRHRECAEQPGFRRSLVPVFEPYLVDVDDGSIWAARFDDEGLEVFEKQAFPDLAAALASFEAEYAARRESPWRRYRVERSGDVPWTTLEQAPDGALLTGMPVGGALVILNPGRHAKGYFLLKIGPDNWAVSGIRGTAPINDSTIDHAIQSVRYGFGDGQLAAGRLDEDIVELIARTIKRWSATDSGEVQRGLVEMWQQPTMDELLTRLDEALLEIAPDVREDLAPPASAGELAAVEAATGAPLPADLRALWAFANGTKQQTACYWRYHLASTTEACQTIAGMRALATDEFGDAYWHPALVPFLDAGTGDELCVDVAGYYGPPGCVLDFDHNQPDVREILFDSVTEWLECFVDGLEAGIYERDEDGRIFPAEFIEDGSFSEIRDHNRARTNGRYPYKRTIALK